MHTRSVQESGSTGNTNSRIRAKRIESDVAKKAAQGDPKAIETVMARLEPYVAKAVQKATTSFSDREDLAQDARLAVLEALPRYDTEHGCSLETFLFHRINGAISNAKSRYTPGFALNHGTTDLYYQAVRDTETLQDARDHAINGLGMSAHAFDGAHSAINGVNHIVSEGEETALSDEHPAGGVSEPSVADFVDSYLDTAVVRDAMRELPERERLVITLTFALDGGEELNDRQIADILGIDRSRINRIRNRGMNNLRKTLEV